MEQQFGKLPLAALNDRLVPFIFEFVLGLGSYIGKV